MEDCENFTTDATSFKREINSFAPHGFTILDISKAKLVSYFIIKTLLVSFLLYYPEICKKIAALRLGLMNKRTEIVSGWFWLISSDFNGTLLDKGLAFSWIHIIQKLMKKGKNNYLDTRCLILLCIARTYSIHILEMCAIEIDHKLFMMHMINVHQCLCSYMYVTVKLTRNVVFSSTYA